MIQEIHSNAEQIDASKIPQFEIDKTVDLYNNEYGQKLFLPYTDGTDGFYIAVMKKKEV